MSILCFFGIHDYEIIKQEVPKKFIENKNPIFCEYKPMFGFIFKNDSKIFDKVCLRCKKVVFQFEKNIKNAKEHDKNLEQEANKDLKVKFERKLLAQKIIKEEKGALSLTKNKSAGEITILPQGDVSLTD